MASESATVMLPLAATFAGEMSPPVLLVDSNASILVVFEASEVDQFEIVTALVAISFECNASRVSWVKSSL